METSEAFTCSRGCQDNEAKGEMILVIRFKGVIVISAVLTVLFSPSAIASAVEAPGGPATPADYRDNPCCNRP